MKQLKKHKAGGKGGLFLGLDLSTQALKSVAVGADGKVRHEAAVNFDRDLPEFGTKGGVKRWPDGLTVTAPPLMWVAALDLLLRKLQSEKKLLANLTAISGSGQQHGSVYLRRGAFARLNALDPAQSLRAQLAGAFALPDAPVWMDSSTTRECRRRDAFLGGPQAVARLTGSRSYERFTGNQIAKIATRHPAAYAATERIALVSSFAASLLIGGYAPLDYADASGMNLMNIFKKTWDRRALDCTGKNLAAKLGPLVPSHKPAGVISGYYADRYGFAPAAVVIAFSGDNPNSLAAFGLERPGATVISLGTSDTIFGALRAPQPSAEEGHIFASPIAPDGYMALVCWKNGSLTREYIRDRFARGSWKAFNAMLAATPPGNNGLTGFYFKDPEITPAVLKPGCRLFDVAGTAGRGTRPGPPPLEIPLHKAAPARHARAVVESQFMAMRLHCGNIGLAPETIIATGGASVNRGLLQIMADVFGRKVHTIELQNSAALGAALRALHGWRCLEAGRFIPFSASGGPAEKPQLQAKPNPAHHKIYTALLPRYRRLEQIVTGRK